MKAWRSQAPAQSITAGTRWTRDLDQSIWNSTQSFSTGHLASHWSPHFCKAVTFLCTAASVTSGSLTFCLPEFQWCFLSLFILVILLHCHFENRDMWLCSIHIFNWNFSKFLILSVFYALFGCVFSLTPLWRAYVPLSPGCRTGEAKLTKGFHLAARFIIHTVGPKYKSRYRTAAESSLHSCYRNVLQLAKYGPYSLGRACHTLSHALVWQWPPAVEVTFGRI